MRKISVRQRTKNTALAVAFLLAGIAGHAHADVIFDNFKGVEAENYVEETRNGNVTFGTVLNSVAVTTITGIQFRWRPNMDMDVTFLIFDSELAGNFGSVNWVPIGNNLLFSQTKHYSAVAGSVDFYLSTDAMTFTFLANHRYDIGIVGSDGTLTGSWDIQNGSGNINTIQGGFESINANANLLSSPLGSDAGYAGVDPHIRLIAADAAAVPEPDALYLLAIGIAGMGYLTRRRQPQR
jgi:hypothetical protein